MSITEQLHQQIAQVCPIVGVSIGQRADKGTWRIDFEAAATTEQRAAAAAVLSAFDLAAAQQQDTLREQRRVLDAQELQDARLDNAITALIDATPAQRMTWANNNFPTLTPAERARMGMVMNMIAVCMRPQLR